MKTPIVIATNAEKNILCSIRGGWWNSKSKLSQNNNFKIHILQKTNRSSHPNVYCKKCALKHFAKFSGKHLRLSLFFHKVARLRPTTLLAETLAQVKTPVSFAKFLRTLFFTEHLRWLLLNKVQAFQWIFCARAINRPCKEVFSQIARAGCIIFVIL